jgi:hypothetical protein
MPQYEEASKIQTFGITNPEKQVLLRISRSSDSEVEMIAHLSNGSEEAECI